MLKITINVNAPGSSAQAIKEALAMYLERWGDSKVVEVRQLTPKEQIEEMRKRG